MHEIYSCEKNELQSIINKRQYSAVVQRMDSGSRLDGFVACVFSSLNLHKVLNISNAQFSHL